MYMNLETADRLLTTTRSVRRRIDTSRPVDPAVIERCIDIATQAPVGGNVPRYHFLVITDPHTREQIAALYKKSVLEMYLPLRRQQSPVFPEAEAGFFASLTHLAEHLHEVPVLIVPCVEGRPENTKLLATASLFANIFPAAWSLMLALRARGVGAAWTTLHLAYEEEARRILGVPDNVTQACLLAVAHYKGEDFKPARRIPGRERTYWNKWGATRTSG
jgi:nitroreductase